MIASLYFSNSLFLTLAHLLAFSTFLPFFLPSLLSKLLSWCIHKSSHKLLWVLIIEDAMSSCVNSLMYDFGVKAKAYGNQLLFLHWNAGKQVAHTGTAVILATLPPIDLHCGHSRVRTHVSQVCGEAGWCCVAEAVIVIVGFKWKQM